MDKNTLQASSKYTKILSPAKINLFLCVTEKRPDGYHNLITLMCRIGLYDKVSLYFDTKDIAVSCNHPNVPADETNLAYKAATLFLKQAEERTGVTITIDKNIPVSAGLGGGSSNAAAVLMGLNRYYGRPFSKEQLMAMGLSLGADIPFFLFEKPALATGIGEKLEVFDRLKPYHVVLICPRFGVSTAEVYKNLNLGLTKCEKKIKNNILEKGDFDTVPYLCNDLETVTLSLYPEIKEFRQTLLKYGARGALMSGSGPAVFGLFPNPEKARSAYNTLNQGGRWQIFLADMLLGGSRI